MNFAPVEYAVGFTGTETGRHVSSQTRELREISGLANNRMAASLAESYGMKIMNVAWEDTARTKGSCFGPNISDMTLNVNGLNMPLIRKPNFADITSDQDITKFSLVVGNENENESDKRLVTLKDYLSNIGMYLGNSNAKNMYLERDSKILTSAQACVLPLHDGEVEFNVKLYNYQSSLEPAVLVIVSSSEGTSSQIVTGRSCTLYFNKNGTNANFIAERLTDDRVRRGVAVEGAMTNEEKQRNALLIFQIPLKVKRTQREHTYQDFGSFTFGGSKVGNFTFGDYNEGCSSNECLSFGVSSVQGSKRNATYDLQALPPNPKTVTSPFMNSTISDMSMRRKANRGFEDAVIKTSDGFGKFVGTEDKVLERDERFPIRCTIQYYKVTDTTDINEHLISHIADQINKQYNLVPSEDRGSLVSRDNTTRTTSHSNTLPYLFGETSRMTNL